MLTAQALRLAAIEVLSPTAAQSSGIYPTMARHLVYDSRPVPLEDLRQDGPYTPVLALYTPESGVKLRGTHASADDTEADAVLEIVAELAVKATENNVEGNIVEFADASASDDPEAPLVLGALCAQVRYCLERSKGGLIWRRLVKDILNTEYKAFGVPELGLRFHRTTIRMHCEIGDDDFDTADGGLPEPIRSLYARLPEGSYAKQKLAVLAGHFSRDVLPSLKEVHITTGPIDSGPKNLSP